MRAMLLLVIVAVGCSGARPQPAPGGATGEDPVALAADWDALCPAAGATEPKSIRIDGAALQFEPSGAAVWQGRVAIAADKQTHLWWWTPGSSNVTRDAAWDATGLRALDGDSCCTTTPSLWGSEIKRQKAQETCQAHKVELNTAVPWLKAEGMSSVRDGLYVTGNMGFGCRDNGSVLRLPGPGAAPVPVGGLSRDDVLGTMAAQDVRVEGVALSSDGDVALIAVRQKDLGEGDALSRSLVVTRGLRSNAPVRTVVEIGLPADGSIGVAQLGLSDVTVLRDGRVAFTLSREDDLDGRRVVGGQLVVTEAARPWLQDGPWQTRRVAEFTDHKPEVVVQLGERCVAVLHDDDEKYKAQARSAGGGDEWSSSASFVSYVRL